MIDADPKPGVSLTLYYRVGIAGDIHPAHLSGSEVAIENCFFELVETVLNCFLLHARV